jgi:hypothetical protein
VSSIIYLFSVFCRGKTRQPYNLPLLNKQVKLFGTCLEQLACDNLFITVYRYHTGCEFGCGNVAVLDVAVLVGFQCRLP